MINLDNTDSISLFCLWFALHTCLPQLLESVSYDTKKQNEFHCVLLILLA